MNKAVVSYQCSCLGINFQSYEVEIEETPLLGFTIKADGEHLEIGVELVDIFDESIAIGLAHDAVCKLLDYLCLFFLVKIGKPYQISISLPQKEKSEVYLIVHNIYQINLIENIQLQYSPSAECLDLLKIQIKDHWNHHGIMVKLFRNSLLSADPVTRYLLLYNVLLFANSDKQKELDKSILTIDSSIETTPSPRDNKPETIFTRLRNEIAHARNGVAYQQTISEIKEHLSKFTDIVKQVVLNNRP